MDIGGIKQKPSVLVKKKDGSTVKMALDEFRAYKKDKKLEVFNVSKPSPVEDVAVVETVLSEKVQESEPQQEPQQEPEPESKPEQKLVEKPVENIPEPVVLGTELKKATGHELSTTAPVKDIFVDEAKASKNKKWTKEDHHSLLQEDVSEVQKFSGKSSLPANSNSSLVANLINDLSFTIEKNLLDRFDTLLVSWSKGVRSGEQLKEYLQRELNSGGLGLDLQKAEEIVNKLPAQKGTTVNKQTETKEGSKVKTENNDLGIKSDSIFDNFKRKKTEAQKQTAIPKTKIHDIHMPEKVTVSKKEGVEETKKKVLGPIGELENFNLVDFRRLSEDPAYSAKILLQKIQGLKEDSYLFFLKGLQAWYNSSPLYKEYQHVLSEIFYNKTKLESLTAKGDGLTKDEFISLVELNKQLDF
jgi:hypothetical protein